MNRRRFITGIAGAFAGLPIAGRLAKSRDRCSAPFPANGEGGAVVITEGRSGITVHGPEVTVFYYAHNRPKPVLSLRFENVPWQEKALSGEVIDRLHPLLGTVNESLWYWYGGPEMPGEAMFTDFSVSPPENGVCRVLCAFTAALARKPWPGSHRPVDFETEILKALEGKRSRRRA